MSGLPRPDVSRFSQIKLDDVVLGYLACASHRAVTAASLRKSLKAFIPPEQCDDLLAGLAAAGKIEAGKTISLTTMGAEAARTTLGRDAGNGWEVIRRRRLPMIALGLNPDDAKTVKSMAGPHALKAAVISVAFGLPEECMRSTSAVVTHLVWRTLRSALADVVGSGPYPPIAKPGAVERVLLAGLTGTRARSIGDAVNTLAAAACGLKNYDIDEVRLHLVILGLSLDGDASQPRTTTKNGFAASIKSIAEGMTTPPFEGRVAIAQIYDTYGRLHADAGPMASFKDRLVSSAKAQDLVLGRLDLPERMSAELRTRSETKWDDDVVHFVITAWK